MYRQKSSVASRFSSSSSSSLFESASSFLLAPFSRSWRDERFPLLALPERARFGPAAPALALLRTGRRAACSAAASVAAASVASA